MTAMPVHQIRCAQCDDALEASSSGSLEREMLRKHWEPYGIHVSVGVAAAACHDAYACRRCSTETPHARVSRLLNGVLSACRVTTPYDIVGGALDTEVLFRESGARLPLVLHRKDADVANSIRTAIEKNIAH